MLKEKGLPLFKECVYLSSVSTLISPFDSTARWLGNRPGLVMGGPSAQRLDDCFFSLQEKKYILFITPFTLSCISTPMLGMKEILFTTRHIHNHLDDVYIFQIVSLLHDLRRRVYLSRLKNTTHKQAFSTRWTTSTGLYLSLSPSTRIFGPLIYSCYELLFIPFCIEKGRVLIIWPLWRLERGKNKYVGI